MTENCHMMPTVTTKQNICPAGREAHSAMQEPVQYNTNLKEHMERASGT